MYFNKSIDNTENSSSMYPEIIEQIKKKSEEISTSEASIKLFQNLSNPTNLTNPQIINSLSRRNKDRNKFILPSLKSRRVISSDKSDFIPEKFLVRSNSNVLSRNHQSSFTNDPFDFNHYKKLIEKAEKDILKKEEKSRMKKLLEKIDKSTDDIISQNNINNSNDYQMRNNLKKNRIDKSINYGGIWEKLKKGKSLLQKKEKDITIDFIKFMPKKQMLERCNNIRLLNFNSKNKNERLKKYISMKNIQMKPTDSLILKLENSKDFLGKKYKEEFKSYIRFLNKTYDEENLKNDDILKEKNDLIKEINKLQRQIDKIKNDKKIITDWIYLQIQVRERKINLPIYYKYIIEDEIPYEQINKISKGKYHLNLIQYNNISNHKKICIYEEADDFFRDLDEIQMKALNKLNVDEELFNEQQTLKSELDELKFENAKWEKRFNHDYKQLINQLNYLKSENENMKKKLIEENIKRSFVRTYKDKVLINKLAIFANKNSNEKGENVIIKNDKPTIFYITLCLYYILKLREFPELNHKNYELDFENSDTYNMFMIFQYAQDCVNILNKERDFYFSNPKTREEYKRIKTEMDKEVRKERLAVKVEMQKKVEDEKIEKFKQKINKKYYKRSRRIDFDYFRKKNKNKNQSLDMNIKRQTKFEDFFYDLDS